MKAKISVIGIVVKNQQAALDYYTKKVGFEKKMDFTPPGGTYRYVTVSPEGQELELALFEEGAKDPNGWSADWRRGTSPPIVMYVDDCKAAFDEMKSRGVEFKQEKPGEYAWGISATFSDPDGNLFSINQRPSWRQ
jgi:predicted enzyme related to lactoylglutathione lyase